MKQRQITAPRAPQTTDKTLTLNDIYPDRDTLLRILDAMHDELYVINADGVCVYVNLACIRHYNVHPHEIIGQNIVDSVRNGYWSPGIGMISFQEKRTATYEIMSNTKQVLLVTATPVFDERGEIELIVENLRNVRQLTNDKMDVFESQKLFDKYYSYLKLPSAKVEPKSIIAESESMKNAFAMAKLIAKSTANVLITGPTGSGKNLLAQFIHENGPSKDGPFITINCAAIPEQLFESEFFGYVYGAFSGASNKGKRGIVALAEGGTLFLDEINSIPLFLQAKLLHFLEERVYAPIGSNKCCHSTCRILAATNQNTLQLIQEKQFREDLYYRLSVLELHIPGLKERKKDFVPLIHFFLERYNKKMNVDCALTEEAIASLTCREWPGNVRELENAIERIVAMSQGTTMTAEQVARLVTRSYPSAKTDLPQEQLTENNVPQPAASDMPSFDTMSLDEALLHVEHTFLLKARATEQSSYKVAAALGINQNRAYRLMKKHFGVAGESAPSCAE